MDLPDDQEVPASSTLLSAPVGGKGILRKLAFFDGRGDPLKKRILPHGGPLPFLVAASLPLPREQQLHHRLRGDLTALPSQELTAANPDKHPAHNLI